MKVYCLFYMLEYYYDDDNKTLYSIYSSREAAEQDKQKMHMNEMIIEEWQVI